MPLGRPEPSNAVPKVLLVVFGAALAGITLAPHSSTRMYAEPWHLLYWTSVIAPALALAWRAAIGTDFFPPARAWSVLAVAGIGVILVSALASPYRATSLLWSALPLSGIAFYFVVHDWLRRSPQNAGRLDRAFAITGIVLMAASLGWWLKDVAAMITSRRTAELFEMRNPHPLGHSNYTAGLVLLFAPWLIAAISQTRGVAKAVYVTGLAMAVVALFTSGSRGGFLGLGMLVAVEIACLRLPRRKLVTVIAAGAIAVALLAVANPRVRGLLRAPDPSAPPNASTVQRVAMLDAGVQMGLARPVIGWGPHTTPLVYPQLRARLRGGAENVLQLHSLPVEIWAGLGALGVGLMIGFVALAIRDSRACKPAAAALAGYLVFSLTDYQLDVPIIVFALAAIAARISRTGTMPDLKRARGAAVTIIAVGAILVGAADRDPTPALNAKALSLAQTTDGRGAAAALLRDSLELNPHQEIAHFNLGWLLLVEDAPAAEQHFRAAARLVPDKGGVYFGLALARLNQGDRQSASRFLALECLNDPRFIGSPWWTEPAIGQLAELTRGEFRHMLEQVRQAAGDVPWLARQIELLSTLAPRIGLETAGTGRAYRRQRIGYTVLMRNHDIEPPIDVYDVRESDTFAETLSFPLPPKGWLPSPLILKLLDAPPGGMQ